MQTMLNTIVGKKLRMSQAFNEESRLPVTLIKVDPCVVTQVKTADRDGYNAIQLGFGVRKLKHVGKPLQGHLKKTLQKDKAPKTLKEVRIPEPIEGIEVGQVIKASEVFAVGDMVAVTGTSKGKGFAGGVKRWHFKGGPKTHGQSDRHRAPGSIGQGTSPGRVLKGKKMAGRMGGDTVTVKGIPVVAVDEEAGTLTLGGPVPGVSGGILIIKKC